jgi:hypothetical protein
LEFTEKTKLGKVLSNKEASSILEKHFPQLIELVKSDPGISTFIKSRNLEFVVTKVLGLTLMLEMVEALQQDLDSVIDEQEKDDEIAPKTNYEDESVQIGSAKIAIPDFVEKWGVFELELQGPDHGNPFVDVALYAEFCMEDRIVETLGFYDGERSVPDPFYA